MADRNKIAAQILKAEMLADEDKVKRLRDELERLDSSQAKPQSSNCSQPQQARLIGPKLPKKPENARVRKFINSTTSLSDMFASESKLTPRDELRMYLKTSAKLSKGDMETKYFSTEVDDSYAVLNRNKKLKRDLDPTRMQDHKGDSVCRLCKDNQRKHLTVESKNHIFMSLANERPQLSRMSNVVLRNLVHDDCNCFIDSSDNHQREVEDFVELLSEFWRPLGYINLITETYLKNQRSSSQRSTSGSGHLQIHCLPIKEKHLERARMCYKQALQNSESEWSLNRKLIKTDGRKIQRYLPKGLSYFWVCFGKLDNGFAHVIENEDRFSQNFSLEILSSFSDKDCNTTSLNKEESYTARFERCRDFKISYGKFKDASKTELKQSQSTID